MHLITRFTGGGLVTLFTSGFDLVFEELDVPKAAVRTISNVFLPFRLINDKAHLRQFV